MEFPISSTKIILADADPFILMAKAAGAVAGSLISIAYVLPRGRREATLRFTVGLVSGLVFGSTAGIKIAHILGVLGEVSAIEITLMGATITSVCAWWGLGVLQRMAEQMPNNKKRGSLLQSIKQANDEKENGK